MTFGAKPFHPQLGKAARKALVHRLRELLSQRPMTMAELAEAAEVEPEAVVVGLRVLRGRKRGVLRSGIRFGHVAWWWEVAPAAAKAPSPSSAGEEAPAKEPRKKKAGKKKRRDEPAAAAGLDAAAVRPKKKGKKGKAGKKDAQHKAGSESVGESGPSSHTVGG